MNNSAETDLKRVRRFGGPISHAALDPERRLFHAEGIDGLLAYGLVGRCAVVMGDPICAAGDKPKLADAFAGHAQENGWSLLYVVASGTMRDHVRTSGWATLEFADLLSIDPRPEPEQGPGGRHLRHHLNRTRRAGVTVREHARSDDGPFEMRVQSTSDRWKAQRTGPQMYLGAARLFDHSFGRRWFIALHGNEVLGCLSMLEAGGTGSPYLINLVFSSPTAPPHTNELMIVTALASLRTEGCSSVCMGIGPRPALGSVEGCSPLKTWLARWLYRASGRLLHPDQKTKFWEKFGAVPQEPLYLLFQDPSLHIRDVYALFRAFHASVQ